MSSNFDLFELMERRNCLYRLEGPEMFIVVSQEVVVHRKWCSYHIGCDKPFKIGIRIYNALGRYYDLCISCYKRLQSNYRYECDHSLNE